MDRRIGDATVSALALGTANLAIDETIPDADADLTIDAAIEAGVSFIDTAAAYASSVDDRRGERLVARALSHHPELFVATKGGHTRESGGWEVDGRPRSIRRDCERSLSVLGVDRIDLYYLHKPDPAASFLDSVGALAELQRAGLIARVGLSNVSEGQLREALDIVPVAAVQNRFSPLHDSDRDCLDMCSRLGITYLPYSPLGGPAGSAGLEQAFSRTSQLSADRGWSLRSVLLAWLLQISPNVLPIVGARRPGSIIDSASAASIELDEEVLASIERERRCVPSAG